MSGTGSGRRSTTPKKQRAKSQIQYSQEDVCVRTSLPPLVEGPVYAVLICHIPKLRWTTKYQSLCRHVNVKVAWWGEDDTSALFKPQVCGTTSSSSQPISATAKYYIRSELKQFARYLIDAAELALKVCDSETNRLLGTAKVQNLSTLSINNAIKGYQSIFTHKGDKLGEVLVVLRLHLPDSCNSNENLSIISGISDTSNPPSRRNSIGATDYNQNDSYEHGLRTYKLDPAYSGEHLNSVHSIDNRIKQQRLDSTVPFKPYITDSQPDIQTHKETPDGKVVEVLIERANRLRENMIKSSLQKPTTIRNETYPLDSILFNTNNNNAEILNAQQDNKSINARNDNIDALLDHENMSEMLGIKTSLKSPIEFNNSNDSILTDLDGLENEQSLLDDLLYGTEDKSDTNNGNANIHTSLINKRYLRGKPPTGRSPSPNTMRVGGLSNRFRSTRSRSVAQSSDSDTASRVSFDMPGSDFDDSGSESNDNDNLSAERIQLLSHVRTAHVRINQLRLNALNSGRESPSFSSFGRTNKNKRASTYFIEYQFPVIANSRDGQKNEATQVMKIASKRLETNNDIIFSHLSTYPCLFNETVLKHWWRSLLIFKIYSRTSGATNPEQIGFAVLPLRNVLKADSLHLEQNLNVIDRTQINQQRLPNKVSKKFCIGRLHVMLELDSDATNFKLELDRIRLIEQNKPKRLRNGRMKKNKKSKQIIVNPTDNLQLPKAFVSEGFMANESLSQLNDGLVIQIYLSIIQARNISQSPNSNNLPQNPYFVCRAFWNEEPVTSIVCWGSSSPRFNFEQKIPVLLTKSTLEKMHNNFVVIELWDKMISSPADKIIGIVKISLEQFYTSFKDKQISQVLLRAQHPVINADSWLPIIDLFSTTSKSNGEIRVLLAMGTSNQIRTVQVTHASNDLMVSSSTTKISSAIPYDDQSSLIEHCFELLIESINGLRAFESMIWGESDCYVQYLFPIQQEQQLTNTDSIKPFELRPIRTATTLCTSDPTFHDTNKFRYILSSNDVLHKYFYAACQSSSTSETCIPFEVWSRFYYPNIRDQLQAKGKLPTAKLCSMTTMLNSDKDNKSSQSFRIPLEIVRENSKHEQYQYSSAPTYGGDLLVTVTYKRNIMKKNERQALTDQLAKNNSQVCVSVGIIRACGLKYAAQVQTRHDARLNYPLQVGVNTYAKLSLSFLSDAASRITRTIARSFVPEFNHSIDFPIPLIWSDNRSQTISLAEILEHGELKIDIYHQMSSTDDLNQYVDKRPLDIHLCYCTISLKQLIFRHTGIKGWYSLASANRVVASEMSSDPSEHCVGGLELSIRFGQQDDRRRVIDCGKALGWFDDNYVNDDNFLDDEKDLGCLITLLIDRIQFPSHLATRPGRNRIDDRTSVFVQYRFYDKMPIITKRKKPIVDRNNIICELKFTKDHLFLCSSPFLWYLREEKLEIQIWTSDNDSYDYSPTISPADKLIGSIYVDLSSFCDRKRKSHRLNAILPMFKHGTKDLGGAFAQVHVTIDKSKDFNELRSRHNFDASNDGELDSYLDNFHLNLIGNDRALCTITNNTFSVIINIEQAAHLPNVYSKQENAHVPPNPYVTYSTANSHHLSRTQVLKSTSKPIWNYQQSVKLAVDHLFNDKKTFILKVWHKVNADIETIPEKSGDKVLGFVSIDLSPLLSGLQQISGWYNIVDTVGNIQGQLKTSIIPQEDLFELKRFKYHSDQNQPKIDSYRSTSTVNEKTPSTDLSARINTDSQASVNLSMVDDENNKKSYLMNNLQRQLGELDAITKQLQTRLKLGSETTPTTNDSSSIMGINRCQSVPPTSTSTPFNFPLNTNAIRQDVDTARSTATTTLQTDLVEHFPESLSGRPLMSNGLNVTDVLSFHNDQVRIAQELMTKANHLLETSKDFFNEAPTSTSPPPLTSLSTVMEKRSTLSPPPALPNLNATNEFRTVEPLITSKNTEQIANSFEQQYYNDLIHASNEEIHGTNHNLLPIGLPPTHHHAMTDVTNIPSLPSPSPPPPPPPLPIQTEENSTHQEQLDERDIVHIRPLNNLSAFNFDRQQMNEERFNDHLSPKPTIRRNIFATQARTDDQQDQELSSSFTERLKRSSPMVTVERQSFSSSTSSPSPAPVPAPPQVRQSLNSDTSIIGKDWLEQQRTTNATKHRISSSTFHERSETKQSSIRSAHLAFLDRPLPNFFPSNREMEASMKRVSEALSTTNTSSIKSASPTSSSNNVMMTVIERLRTKPSSELLRGVSPLDNTLLHPSESSSSPTVNVMRLEKIFKTKFTTTPSSN